MRVVFIRHASAEPTGAGGDAGRKLTKAGRKEAQNTAKALLALGVKLERVLTSPLDRAVETARLTAEAHGGAEVEVVDFLAPPGDTPAMCERLDELNEEGLGAVGLVGHAPSMDEFVARLAADTDDVGTRMNKAGAACIELPPAGSGDSPELRWLMRRKQLAMLAEGA